MSKKKQKPETPLASILTQLKHIDKILRGSPDLRRHVRDERTSQHAVFTESVVPLLTALAEDIIFVRLSARKLDHPLTTEILALLARVDERLSDAWNSTKYPSKSMSDKDVNDRIIDACETTYNTERAALLDLIGRIAAGPALRKPELKGTDLQVDKVPATKRTRCVAEPLWLRVQKKVENHWKKLKKRGQSFPSMKSIAGDIGENPTTVKKAILYSRSLTQAYNKGKPKQKKLKYIEPSKLKS